MIVTVICLWCCRHHIVGDVYIRSAAIRRHPSGRRSRISGQWNKAGTATDLLHRYLHDYD